MRDGQGLEVANASAETIAAIDLLREEWLAFGKRLPEAVAAADREQGCALLPLMSANLLLTVNSPAALEIATRQAAKGRKLAGSDRREQGWLAATEAAFAHDKRTAQKLLEDLLAEWPRDLVAAKVAQVHAIDRGDAEGILRIGERIVPANPDVRHVIAMRAFGLEECNRIDEAEAEARRAIEVDRRDPWAHHVVAHCLEARGRMLEGVAFLRSMSDTWAPCNSFMYTHNWWHLALFLIDLDRGDEALARVQLRRMRREGCFARHLDGLNSRACFEPDALLIQQADSRNGRVAQLRREVNEIIEERFHPSAWNLYAVHLSDGDNYDSDNGKYLEQHAKIEGAAQLFGYVELEPVSSSFSSYADEVKLSKVLKPRIRENSRCVTIHRKDDVWPAFREMLGATKGPV